MLPVQVAPLVEGFQHGRQRQAVRRECVLDAGRHFGVDFSRHETRFFQLAELLGEHFLSYARDCPLQLAEAAGALHELAQDKDLPLAAEHIEGSRDGTDGFFFRFFHPAML